MEVHGFKGTWFRAWGTEYMVSSMGYRVHGFEGNNVKVLGTFQACSHRTILISFALGACPGPAASNAWQEMSQYNGGWSLLIPVGFVPI